MAAMRAPASALPTPCSAPPWMNSSRSSQNLSMSENGLTMPLRVLAKVSKLSPRLSNWLQPCTRCSSVAMMPSVEAIEAIIAAMRAPASASPTPCSAPPWMNLSKSPQNLSTSESGRTAESSASAKILKSSPSSANSPTASALTARAICPAMSAMWIIRSSIFSAAFIAETASIPSATFVIMLAVSETALANDTSRESGPVPFSGSSMAYNPEATSDSAAVLASVIISLTLSSTRAKASCQPAFGPPYSASKSNASVACLTMSPRAWTALAASSTGFLKTVRTLSPASLPLCATPSNSEPRSPSASFRFTVAPCQALYSAVARLAASTPACWMAS